MFIEFSTFPHVFNVVLNYIDTNIKLNLNDGALAVWAPDRKKKCVQWETKSIHKERNEEWGKIELNDEERQNERTNKRTNERINEQKKISI